MRKSLLLLLVMAVVAACGRKLPPEPPEILRPTAPVNVAASVAPDGQLALSWEHDGSGSLDGFSIYRRDVVCETCPVSRTRVAVVGPRVREIDLPLESRSMTYEVVVRLPGGGDGKRGVVTVEGETP